MMSDSHEPNPEASGGEPETSAGGVRRPSAAKSLSPASPPDAEESLSAEHLVNAFAKMLGTDQAAAQAGGGEAADAESTISGVEITETQTDLATLPEDDSGELSPKSILEAMFFVGNPDSTPLVPEQIAELMRGVEPSDIPRLVDELNRDYEANHCPYHVTGEGAGYRMVLREEYHGLRDKLYGRARRTRLSRPAIEVLAIVAYNQPLTSDEVSRIRGTSSGGVLAQLVRRQLLRIERRDEKPRKVHYRSTERFLKLFGLECLDDLPRSQDLEKR